MKYKLKRIRDNNSIFRYMFENSWFNICHLIRKKIGVNIIITLKVSLKEIFFIDIELRIS